MCHQVALARCPCRAARSPPPRPRLLCRAVSSPCARLLRRAVSAGGGKAADVCLGGRFSASTRQGKMGTISNAQDLSEMLEEFQSNISKVPVVITRSLQMIRMLDNKVDEARAQIRKESEQYGCAKDQKSAGSLEIKKSIDSRQTNCLSWCDEKESHANSCVQLVTKELAKLDECISNIDESLFTNMEAEEESSAVNARSGGSGAMGSSRPNAGGGGGGGDRDRKRKSGVGGGGGGGGGSDKYAWVVEGALCEVEWDGEYWQAKILRVKVKNQSSSGSLGSRAIKSEVLVGYIGGTEERDILPLGPDRATAEQSRKLMLQ